jgi:hypothetical protein
MAERSQQSAAPGQDVAIAHQRYAMQLAGGYLRDGRRREHTLRRRRIRVVTVAENAVLAAAPAEQHSWPPFRSSWQNAARERRAMGRQKDSRGFN